MSVRGLLLIAVGALYLLSVPWYRGDDPNPPQLLGVPNWVAVSLLCYALAAILNACAWALAEVPDELPEALQTEGEGSPGAGESLASPSGEPT